MRRSIVHSALGVRRAATEVDSNAMETVNMHNGHNFALCRCAAGPSTMAEMKRERKAIKVCFIPVAVGPRLNKSECMCVITW